MFLFRVAKLFAFIPLDSARHMLDCSMIQFTF